MDSTSLSVRVEPAARDSPWVVVCNTVGVPYAVFDRLVATLAGAFSVVCWQTSLTEGDEPHGGPRHLAVADQTAEVTRVLHRLGVTEFTGVSWCSGTEILYRLSRGAFHVSGHCGGPVRIGVRTRRRRRPRDDGRHAAGVRPGATLLRVGVPASRRTALSAQEVSAISSGNPYLVFSGLALAVVLMPGADTILVFRMSRALGTRMGLMTAVGVVTGPVLWGMFSGIGVALVITRNKALYIALALLGALYLLYLAYGCFKAAASGSAVRLDAGDDAPPGPGTMRGAYVTGLLTNLLNPKIGVFYLSVMPGLFQGEVGLWDGGSLGLIQATMGIAFLGSVALLAGRARRYLSSHRASLAVETLAGAWLLAFAAYVTWSVLHSPGGLAVAVLPR